MVKNIAGPIRWETNMWGDCGVVVINQTNSTGRSNLGMHPSSVYRIGLGLTIVIILFGCMQVKKPRLVLIDAKVEMAGEIRELKKIRERAQLNDEVDTEYLQWKEAEWQIQGFFDKINFVIDLDPLSNFVRVEYPEEFGDARMSPDAHYLTNTRGENKPIRLSGAPSRRSMPFYDHFSKKKLEQKLKRVTFSMKVPEVLDRYSFRVHETGLSKKVVKDEENIENTIFEYYIPVIIGEEKYEIKIKYRIDIIGEYKLAIGAPNP